MELICPSCEARYQLPDGAIGEKGRQVSCMSCGHGWHAYPPLVLNTSNRSSSRPSSVGIPFGAAAGGVPGAAPAVGPEAARVAPSAPERPQPSPEDVVATSGGMPEASSSSRTQQLAEIREMLAEVQAEDQAHRPSPADEPEQVSALRAGATGAAAVASDGAGRLRDAALADANEPERVLEARAREPVDPLEERFHNKAKQTEKAKPVDVKSIRRRHGRKERNRKRENAPGTGAFLTGFLLVVILVAVLIGLYVLHPAIINRMPATADALNEYVATVDGFRVSIAETFEQVKRMVTGT